MKKRFKSFRAAAHFVTAALLLSVLLLASCSEIGQVLQQVNIQKPRARVEKVKLTGLSFKKVDLNFNVGVTNPNPVAVKLSGFDYDFLLNNHSFLKGSQQKNLQISAGGKSSVDIPLSLTFAEIYKTFNSLKGADSIKYQLKLKLGVNLPVLGVVKIPLSSSGYFPNLRLPAIRFKSIRLKKISLSGAQLDLGLQLKNPNALNFTVKKLNYQLDVNGTNWLSGLTKQPITIHKKDQSEIHLPITLNFMDMGMAVYRLLTSDQKLNYHLKGKADFNTPLQLLHSFSLPFDESGKIDLIK